MAKRKPRTLSQIAALMEEANTEGTHNAMIWVSPNLFLQVRENSKTWQMRWTVGDRIHSMGLGRAFDPVALDEARRLVGRYMEVVRAGGDPREARDRERLEAGLKPAARRGPDAAQPVSINSFRDVTRAFLADRASSWKSDATEMHFARQMRDYAYPTMGDTPIDKITIEHVVEVLRPLWRDHRPTAVKLRSRIGQVVDWAEAMGWRSGGNPARSKAIVALLGNSKHRPKHFTAIHYAQLPAFCQRIAEMDERFPAAADALRLQLLTAVRPSDATSAEWSEIDFENRVWTIPAARMKMGREHRVPLSDQAMDVLQRRKELTSDNPTGPIFPGTKPGQPMSRSALLKLIKRLGVNATAHGTARSSCREWAAEVDGQGFEICEAILAHQEKSATVAAYQRSDLLGPRGPVMQRWADFLTGRSISTAK